MTRDIKGGSIRKDPKQGFLRIPRNKMLLPVYQIVCAIDDMKDQYTAKSFQSDITYKEFHADIDVLYKNLANWVKQTDDKIGDRKA